MINLVDKDEYLHNFDNYVKTLDNEKLLQLLHNFNNELHCDKSICEKCLEWCKKIYDLDGEKHCKKCLPPTIHCKTCKKHFTNIDLQEKLFFTGYYGNVCCDCVIKNVGETLYFSDDFSELDYVKNYDWYFHCFEWKDVKYCVDDKFAFPVGNKFFNKITRFNHHGKFLGINNDKFCYDHPETLQQVLDNMKLLYIHMRRQHVPKPICQMIISFYLL